MRFIRLSFIALVSLLFGQVASAQEFKVYFGNLHSHTSYSDGSGIPHEAYRHARDAAKMDFLAITEHNHARAEDGASADRKDGILIAKDPSLYNGPDQLSLIRTAKAMTEDGKFVALYGQEFSSISQGNHANVFDAPELIDIPNGAFDKLLAWIEGHPDSFGQKCIVQFNHPGLYTGGKLYGRDDFGSEEEWVKKMGAVARTIEVLNGPAMTKSGGERAAEVAVRDYQKFLLKGFKLGPTADQDNHYFTWGTATDARTGVVMEGEITKKKLLDAIRSRHVYATEDKNLAVIAKVNGRLAGDEVAAPAPNSVLQIELSIHDKDEPSASYDIDVVRGQIGGSSVEVVESVAITPDGDQSTIWTIDNVQYTGGSQFFYFVVTQHDEDGGKDRVWTAPVWFTTGGSGGVSPLADSAGSPAEFVLASKRSNVYHTSEECEFGRKIQAQNRVSGAEAKAGRKQCLKCKELEQRQ